MFTPEVLQCKIVNFAVHSDDEAMIGGPTMYLLNKLGYPTGVVGVSLGRTDERAVRKIEMEAGCAELGFEPIFLDDPFHISETEGDNLSAAEPAMVDCFADIIKKLQPELIISPSVSDNHPAHEAVARAVMKGIVRVGDQAESKKGIRWWMAPLWGHIAAHTIISPYDADTLSNVQHALEKYVSQITNTDYVSLLACEGEGRQIKGPQTVFSTGKGKVIDLPYADIFTEVIYENGQWNEGKHRVLDLEYLFTAEREVMGIGPLLERTSDYQFYRDLKKASRRPAA
jgi:LmbE family N-acetylglucosaminyl deacetylase